MPQNIVFPVQMHDQMYGTDPDRAQLDVENLAENAF